MTAPGARPVRDWIRDSSLGTDAARELSRRTTEADLDRIRRLVHTQDETGAVAAGSARVAAGGARTVGEVRQDAPAHTLTVAVAHSVAHSDAASEEADDAELVRRHMSGDPDAFEVLVRRHRDRMWAVAIRTLGDPEQAADALQDAFLSAYRRADSFRGDAKVTTWLHRIVVNACLDRIRRRQMRAADPLPEDEDRPTELTGPTPDDDLAERRLEVLNALKQLNEDQRSALILVDMEGYSIEEAAAILGCAVGTVKSRCARGRARLLPLLRHRQAPEAPAGGEERLYAPPQDGVS